MRHLAENRLPGLRAAAQGIRRLRRDRTPGRLARALGALALVAGVGACDDAAFPRDPDRTLETVLATRQMSVAVVEHLPWAVLDSGDVPSGAEVALVEALARDLGVGIDWRRLSAFEALEGLERGDIDLAIGGFLRAEVTSASGAAPSYGYFEEALTIGMRPGATAPDGLDGQRVFVPEDQPVATLVRDEGGMPVEDWGPEVDLAAVPHWQLEPMGLVPTGIVLHRAEHVVAFPKGENAWVMRVERFLRTQTPDMATRLREHLE